MQILTEKCAGWGFRSGLLYGELTGRVVSIIRQEAPAYFRYSIDECFVYLNGMEPMEQREQS